MQPPFVKKFDFRGIYNEDLKDRDAFYLGLAVQKSLPLKKILIGWDTRASSRALAMNFIQAFEGTAIEICYLEKCPIDYVTAGGNAFDFDFSVMFTGSHNAWNWSGLLMHTEGGASVEGDLVTKIVAEYNASLATPYQEPAADLTTHTNFKESLEAVYSKKIQELVPLQDIKPMHVVVDLGDGSGAMSLDLLQQLVPQVTFDRLNTRDIYDADTPHTADPSIMKNMEQLIGTMKQNTYDAGFAFDSDADRVLAVDESGGYINGSMIGGAMIEMFAKRNKDMKKFGYAVECGPAMYNAFVDAQKTISSDITIEPIPVGRSILRRLIREGVVDLAVENVGHFYTKDFFMTDSGVFSIVLLLSWMSEHGKLSSLSQKHPDGQRSQSHFEKDDTYEQRMQDLIESVNSELKERTQKKITKDGIRYEFYEDDKLVTWYALRPSGYEPIIKYYFGSLDAKDFTYLTEKFTQ